eukprot:6038248-Pleurochrysis_carterae.AAC.3
MERPDDYFLGLMHGLPALPISLCAFASSTYIRTYPHDRFEAHGWSGALSHAAAAHFSSDQEQHHRRLSAKSSRSRQSMEMTRHKTHS